MKLPILELKRIGGINNKDKNQIFQLTRKKTVANFFLLPKPNIFSMFSENKLKSDSLNKESQYTQRHTKHNNNIITSTKSKLINLNKSKNDIFIGGISKNKNKNDYLSSYNCKSSNRITSNEIESTEEDSDKNNNYEKYIKKTLNSFKIKKEISSFLYSSPDKQKRLINFLSHKFNKKNNNNIDSNINNDNINFANIHKIKIKKRLINIKENDKNELDNSFNEKDNDLDEDKTNLKEFSLFSLFIGNKSERVQNRIKCMKNINKNKYIECWDNNLLKNILPKNIKPKSDMNFKSVESDNNSFRSRQGDSFFQLNGVNTLNLNSINTNIINRYKYQYQYNLDKNKKQRAFQNDLYLFNSKRLTRSSSNLK
jgi:hypothetical protein